MSILLITGAEIVRIVTCSEGLLSLCLACMITTCCFRLCAGDRIVHLLPHCTALRIFKHASHLITVHLHSTTNSNLVYVFLLLQYARIESKKMYVRYISHELRTPLNSACLGTYCTVPGRRYYMHAFVVKYGTL